MIILEIKKLVKEGAIIFFVLLAIFAAMLMTNKEAYLAPPFELSLILFASFIGWSMFDRERQEGAMEYLLSLPVSRSKLFFIKFIPRTAYVLLILFLYYFVHRTFEMHFFLTFLKFALFFLTVYLLSVSFSLSIKSFLGTFFLTIFLAVSLFFLIKYLDWSRDESAISIQATLSLLVIPVLFFFLFRKFDIKPISYFNVKFIPALVLIVLLVFGINYLTTGVEWAFWHLTADGDILKTSRKKTALLKRNKQKLMFKERIEPLTEDKGMLYAALGEGRKQPDQLVRVDMETGEIEKLYRAEPGWWFHTFTDSGVKTGGEIYFLLTGENHKEYKIVELGPDGVRTTAMKIDLFPKESFCKFHGVAGDPLQLFIITDSKDRPSRIFRVFENGESEFLFEADAISVHKNRIARFTSREITVYKVGKELEQIFRKEGDIRIVKRKFDGVMPRKVIVKIDSIYYIFDIEAETFTKVNLKSLPYDYVLSPKDDILNIVFLSRTEVSFSEFIDGRLRQGKVWFLRIDPEEFRMFRVFSSGVTVNSKNDNEVFLFDEGE